MKRVNKCFILVAQHTPVKLKIFFNMLFLIKTFLYKGTFQKRFSGFFLLRGGVPPNSAKEKNLLFFTLIFR